MIVIYSIFKISSCDMSSITAKLHENLVSGFRELAITVTVVYLNLVKYLSSKEALLKKLSSYEHAHLHSMSFPNTKFHEILLSSFKSIAVAICFSSIFNFGQIKSRGKSPCKHADLYTMSFMKTKFHEILLSGFKSVAMTKKNPTKTNNQTHQVKRSDVTRCMGV